MPIPSPATATTPPEIEPALDAAISDVREIADALLRVASAFEGPQRPARGPETVEERSSLVTLADALDRAALAASGAADAVRAYARPGNRPS